MKKVILVLALFWSANSFAQKKDTIPPVKKYQFTFDENQFKYVDSVLQRAHYFVGRKMDFDEADLLKNAFGAVIQFLLAERQKQEAAVPKK